MSSINGHDMYLFSFILRVFSFVNTPLLPLDIYED